MADIFGYKRNPKPESVFSNEESYFTMSGMEDATGMLVQSWQANYQQQVQELFEIGTQALYWVKGRPVGQGTLGRVVGKKGNPLFFPDEGYDICEGGVKLDINAKSGVCDNAGAGIKISMDGCIVTNIGFSMQVQDTFLRENVGWRFAWMSID
jgi:hypothetical protein